MARTPTTYWQYIKTEEILALQTGRDGDEQELTNDEVMFIVVHQIDELWFKLMLRELVTVRDLFAAQRVEEQSLSTAVRGLRRIELLLRQISSHFALMETLTTRDYLAFRDKLSPASGFQSAQLREVEILLGLAPEDRIKLGNEGTYMTALRESDGSESAAYRRVARRLEDTPSLRDALWTWLRRTPIYGSTPEQPDDDAVVRRFIDRYIAAQRAETEAVMRRAMEAARADADRERLKQRFLGESEKARAFLMAEDVPEEARARTSRVRASLLFIESYRELPLLAWPREVLDAIVGLEQAFVIFRQRHARMVERVIGRRTGTGGSAGVDYLDQTALRYRIFHDVWAVRTLLIRRAALPSLDITGPYGFATET
jgi:tryptophan 2,3-dioxygenase